MKNKILLLDTSSVIYTCMYATGNTGLKHEEHETFLIYSFLFKLRYLIKKSYPTSIVFALDSKESLRKDFYPGYKSKRTNKTPEQKKLLKLAKPQIEYIQNELLEKLGYTNVFKADGFEADDILAKICKSYPKAEIDIVTDDKDLYQLLSENVDIIKSKSGSRYTVEDLKYDFGVSPYLWRGVKSIGGCTSDSVEGVRIPDDKGGWSKRGVGEGTAIKYVLKELPHHHKSYVAIRSKQGKETIERNKKLVILPYKGTPEFRIRQDSMNLDAFIEVCNEFNFKTLLSDLSDWKKILRFR